MREDINKGAIDELSPIDDDMWAITVEDMNEFLDKLMSRIEQLHKAGWQRPE
jgi:hypothetical protein